MSENINTISRITVGGTTYELKSNIAPKIVTWEELKKLKDSNELSPGLKYRIVDYAAYVVENSDKPSYLSADSEVKFNIIIEALTTGVLSENAVACSSSGEDYSVTKINAWEIKYCLDNDTSRFAWANTKGKGVIYYMKDEHGNSAYYDFMGLLFDGNKTFSDGCKGNTIGHCFKDGFPTNIQLGENSINNKIGNDCSNIKLGDNSSNNTIGNNCSGIELGNDCHSNSFGDNCYNNSLGNGCYSNNFGNACYLIGFYTNNTFSIDEVTGNYTSNSELLNFTNNCKFGDGCGCLLFYTTYDNKTNGIQNLNVAQGLKSTKKESDYSIPEIIEINAVNQDYETKIARNSRGFIKVYCEADLIWDANDGKV